MTPEVEYIDQGRIFHGSVPYVMGTRFDILMIGASLETAQHLWISMTQLLEKLDSMLNRFSPESEVSHLNNDASIQGQSLSWDLSLIMELALEYHEKTEGLFDVTRGHMGEIEFTERGTVSLYGNTLDFGGFAKGYYLKRVKEILQTGGIDSAYADFGGSSILAIGSHPYGDCWKVELTDPFSGLKVDEISLKDSSLSTSGNTASYSGHIVNPFTGQPVEDRALSTVVSPDPLDAEVLSTVLFMADDTARERIITAFPKAINKIYKLQ